MVRSNKGGDGPANAEQDREAILLRGRRLDESKSGAGLGLAIVGDLAEFYRARWR